MTQYKQLITSSLQRFSVHCGSILHLKINILIIYIGSFPCTPLNRHRHDRNEKNPFFRIRKSGLLPPELLGLTRQSPLFRTQKSLVSRLTQILYDRPHLQGESTSSFLSSNRYPVALSLAPGFPHPFGQPFPCRCRHQIRTVKDRQFLPPVTPDFEFIQHHNPIVLLPYKDKQ